MAEDFQEEDVWAKMKARSECSNSSKTSPSLSIASPMGRRFPAAAHRGIPKASGGGGTTAASGLQKLSPPRRSSAPVSIPDWSQILKKPGSNKNPWDDDACEEDDVLRHFQRGRVGYDVADDKDDEDDMLPPHEYLARRLARTQIASFSMCEGGIGRTLKGRDQSNLRKAILSKTGFLE